MKLKPRTLLAGLSPLLLAGCVSTSELALQTAPYEDTKAGFQTVSAKSSAALGKHTAWAQTQDETRKLKQEVHALIHKKTISADTAVLAEQQGSSGGIFGHRHRRCRCVAANAAGKSQSVDRDIRYWCSRIDPLQGA